MTNLSSKLSFIALYIYEDSVLNNY